VSTCDLARAFPQGKDAMRIILSHGVGHAAAPNAASGPEQTALSSSAFLDLLRTRLGLTGPDAGHPQRTAQYRALMAAAGHPWYRDSFALDPWNTARAVLTLRDDAIAAGWTHDPHTAPAESATAQPRLAALAAIEALVTVGSPRQARATLAPGPADQLRDVLDHLRRLVDGGHAASWPLGIERVDVADAREDLPPLWRTLLDLLADCGVDIAWTEETPFALADLTVSRGRDEWSTAESAARFLATAPDPSAVVIIAGDDTAVLDQQLRRRGLPTVGAAPTTAADPAAQLLPLFLTALIPPLDVHRIAELLALRITTDAAAAAGTRPTATRSVGLVPSAARSALIQALGQEAGPRRPAHRRRGPTRHRPDGECAAGGLGPCLGSPRPVRVGHRPDARRVPPRGPGARDRRGSAPRPAHHRRRVAG
jgi:hypothetical protein